MSVQKTKKSVDEQISSSIGKLSSLYEKKFSNTKMSDTEKGFAKIVSNALKAKQEGKGSKTKQKINSELLAIVGKESPFKEDYYLLVGTLIRASLDAQSKPVQPRKPKSSG